MKRLAGWADAYALLMAPHNVCGPVGTMANLHFAVATPNYKVLEHFNDFADAWTHDLVDHSARIDPADGCFVAPEAPGLGLKLNHDAAGSIRAPAGASGCSTRAGNSGKASVTTSATTIELALDARAELGEGPIWDADRARLLFVDIMRGHVHEFDPVDRPRSRRRRRTARRRGRADRRAAIGCAATQTDSFASIPRPARRR